MSGYVFQEHFYYWDFLNISWNHLREASESLTSFNVHWFVVRDTNMQTENYFWGLEESPLIQALFFFPLKSMWRTKITEHNDKERLQRAKLSRPQCNHFKSLKRSNAFKGKENQFHKEEKYGPKLTLYLH